MLELLVTSNGSSGSCGVKKGTGCSAGLRAVTPPDAGSQRQHSRKEKEKKVRKEGQRRRKDKMENK